MSDPPTGPGRGGRTESRERVRAADRLSPGWSPDRALALAREAGLGPLGDRHWRVLTTFREETARTGEAPPLDVLAHLAGIEPAEILTLFPGDGEQTLARLAGLVRRRRAPSSRRTPPAPRRPA